MASTYEPIGTVLLSSTSASLTVSSIPATYTDLRIVFSGKVTTSNAFIMRFNGDTASNYGYQYLYSYGTGAGSSTSGNETRILMDAVLGQSQTQFHLYEFDVLNYTSSVNKSILNKVSASNNTSAGGAVVRYVRGWRNSSAITSVVISRADGSTSIAAGSRLTVYGILRA